VKHSTGCLLPFCAAVWQRVLLSWKSNGTDYEQAFQKEWLKLRPFRIEYKGCCLMWTCSSTFFSSRLPFHSITLKSHSDLNPIDHSSQDASHPPSYPVAVIITTVWAAPTDSQPCGPLITTSCTCHLLKVQTTVDELLLPKDSPRHKVVSQYLQPIS
jgi:hypothetical protein